MFESSMVNYPERGKWGNSKWAGNTTGKIVWDFLDYLEAKFGSPVETCSDYMVGSGTTREVCEERGVKGVWTDLHMGFDLLNNDIPDRPQSIFWHPPYYGMIKYSDNMYSAKEVQEKYGVDALKSDLSRMSDDEFIKAMNYCCLKLFAALESSGGRLGILMGDRRIKGHYKSMLLDIVKPGEVESIVIKKQNNTSSGRKSYGGKFIPIEQEYFLILKKVSPYILDFTYTKLSKLDIRDSSCVTWKEVVAAVIRHYNRPVSLEEIYSEVSGHKKAATNTHWKEKVRQTLQVYDIFSPVERGVWRLAV